MSKIESFRLIKQSIPLQISIYNDCNGEIFMKLPTGIVVITDDMNSKNYHPRLHSHLKGYMKEYGVWRDKDEEY